MQLTKAKEHFSATSAPKIVCAGTKTCGCSPRATSSPNLTLVNRKLQVQVEHFGKVER